MPPLFESTTYANASAGATSVVGKKTYAWAGVGACLHDRIMASDDLNVINAALTGIDENHSPA